MQLRALDRGSFGFLDRLRRAQDELNRFLGALPLAQASEFPPVNVWANADGAIVTAKLPGLTPEQLEITVHQDTLVLSGKIEPEAFAKDAIVHRRERPSGPFTRTIALPFKIDAEKVSARASRGILTLELPRPAIEKPRQIRIARA
ncbi:MAG TPA: Hsp20/alpha crystallin family protein [Myxococcota bacterium]|nr:Hsp20/alpha crystallin family protein [Myxococcota bacterium]